MQYSCDPVLNEIVTAHIDEYVKYSVTELTTNYLPVQQAIFRTYTPEKRRELWLEKINYLLANESYTTEEYSHVYKLIGRLSENCFNTDTLKATAQQRAQLNTAWISYAKETLGWTDRYIAFVVYRLYTKQSQFDSESALHLLESRATADGEGTEIDTCSCAGNECGYGAMCETGNCNTVSGCGFFMTENCTGLCITG